MHLLDAGRYRAVIRHGVPVIERADTTGAVVAIERDSVLEASLPALDPGEVVYRLGWRFFALEERWCHRSGEHDRHLWSDSGRDYRCEGVEG